MGANEGTENRGARFPILAGGSEKENDMAEKKKIELTKFEDVDFTADWYWRVPISPELAEEIYTTRNYTMNRRLKRKNETYTRDMQTGKWVEGTGETVKFGSDGIMYDGQNRMIAIAKCGKTIVVDIKTGLDKSVYEVLDSGVSRTDGDALNGLVPNAPLAASFSRQIQTLYNGANNMQSHVGINVAPSRQEVVSFAIDNNDAIQSGIKLGRRLTDSIAVSGVGATGWFIAYWLTYERDKEAADEFFDMFVNEDKNVKQLRADLMMKNEDGGNKSKEYSVNRYIDSFNAIMLDKDYAYGSNRDEIIKARRKLFVEYLDNMRACGKVFEF